MIGIVKEVFIPKEYNENGVLVDVMDSTNIGFKVLVENKEIEIIQKQNEINCNIFREDEVIVTKNSEGYDIQLYSEV